MRFSTVILFLFLFFSCSKEKNNKPIAQKNASPSVYFDLYKSSLTNNNIKDQKNLEKAFEIVKMEKNEIGTRKLLSEIVLEFYKNSNKERLNESSKLLLKISSESKDSINLGMAYRTRGHYYYKIQKLDSSYYSYLKAEKIYNKLNDKQNYSTILMNKGIIQYSIGDYLGAELSLSIANSIFKENKVYNQFYGSLDQLGLVAIELKEYDKAKFYFDKALLAIEDLPSIDDRIYYKSVCNNNIGYLYLKSEDYEKGAFYFEEALKNESIVEEDELLYSNLIDNLAYCKLHFANSAQLSKLFFESLEIRKKLKNSTAIVGSYVHLSEFFYNQNKIEEAVKYSLLGLKEAKESKIPSNVILALKQVSLIDKNNASKYSSEYIRISDSLQIAERNSKDRFARIQLETNELRAENSEITARNKEIFGYFVIFCLVGGMLFYTRLQRMKIREESLKLSQKSANEEIYRLIIDHQNKLEEGKELEKKRISQELHDGILGRIFGLRLNLDGLNSSIEEEAVNLRMDYLNELKIIEQDLREISHDLNRENLVVINNFIAIIDSLIETQSKNNKANVYSKITQKVNWDKVSNIRKINIYRIIQESLQNINKYAFAKNVSILLKLDKKGNLNLTIEDDGVGYDANNKKNSGIGTKNIFERTKQCNGKIEIDSTIGKGTKIFITFPPEIEPKTTTDAPNY